jgi:hypothetical protein
MNGPLRAKLMPLCRGGVQELQNSRSCRIPRPNSGVRSQNSGAEEFPRLPELLRAIRALDFGWPYRNSSVPAILLLRIPAPYSATPELPATPVTPSESPKDNKSLRKKAQVVQETAIPRPDTAIAKPTEASYSRCVPRSDTGDRCTLAWRRGRVLRGCPREPRLPR